MGNYWLGSNLITGLKLRVKTDITKESRSAAAGCFYWAKNMGRNVGTTSDVFPEVGRGSARVPKQGGVGPRDSLASPASMLAPAPTDGSV